MRRLFLAGLLVLTLLLASCITPNDMPGGKSEDTGFFDGVKGVRMKFVDPDSPPPVLYYYSDTEDNTFDIQVEVWNKGASFARGGLYLSGYDPNLIHVRGINPDLSADPFGACGFSIGNIGFGSFGVDIHCDAGRIQVGDRGVSISAENVLEMIQRITDRAGFDKDKLLGKDFDINLDWTGENFKGDLDLKLGDKTIDIEYGSRGRLMIALFGFIDFTDNFGTEYLLAGNIPDFPGGDLAIVDWDANVVHWPPGLDQTKQTFLVTNCYLYTTHAAPIVCIDPAPFVEGEKVCQPTGYFDRDGQGSPVGITSVTQENSPRQAIFTINVQNLGGGTVWDPASLHKCSPYQKTRVSTADHNIVWLGQIRVSGDPVWLDCVPDDFIRLDRDTQSGIITCRYDIPFGGLRSAYQTPLVVELWYGYEESIRREVTLKRAI